MGVWQSGFSSTPAAEMPAPHLREPRKLHSGKRKRTALQPQISLPRKSAFRKRAATDIGRATRRSSWRWPFGTQKRLVSFSDTVQVKEFKRVLDGGCTVPGDGTIVTLGLGKFIRTTYAKLAPAARRWQKRIPIEERAWVPSPMRVKLLRKSMGDMRYLRGWVRHKREIVQVRRNRLESSSAHDPAEVTMMPTSLEEAMDRARLLRNEVRCQADIDGCFKPNALKSNFILSESKDYKLRCLESTDDEESPSEA